VCGEAERHTDDLDRLEAVQPSGPRHYRTVDPNKTLTVRSRRFSAAEPWLTRGAAPPAREEGASQVLREPVQLERDSLMLMHIRRL